MATLQEQAEYIITSFEHDDIPAGRRSVLVKDVESDMLFRAYGYDKLELIDMLITKGGLKGIVIVDMGRVPNYDKLKIIWGYSLQSQTWLKDKRLT